MAIGSGTERRNGGDGILFSFTVGTTFLINMISCLRPVNNMNNVLRNSGFLRQRENNFR